MGWHPICKSKSNQIIPRPTDKSMPKGASFQMVKKLRPRSRQGLGKGRTAGGLPRARRSRPRGGNSSLAPLSVPRAILLKRNIYIFQLKLRPPLSHFSELWIDLLDFPILSLPTRLFETLWMEVSDADVPSHPFPSLVFCEVFKLTSCLGLQFVYKHSILSSPVRHGIINC